MGYYIKIDEQMLVQEVKSTTVPPDGFIAVEGGNLSLLELANCMLVEGVLVLRPVSPEPYVENGQIIVPPCPIGTEISVSDVLGHEVMGIITTESDELPEEISFPDPGRYRVEVQAPFPHIYSAIELEIP